MTHLILNLLEVLFRPVLHVRTAYCSTPLCYRSYYWDNVFPRGTTAHTRYEREIRDSDGSMVFDSGFSGLSRDKIR